MIAVTGREASRGIGHAGHVDLCPSCGELLPARTVRQVLPADRESGLPARELRRCAACRHVAWRRDGTSGSWADSGPDPGLDYLFDWRGVLLPGSWAMAAPATRAALKAELLTELCEGHELSGQPVTAIARCQSCDDAVFTVDTDPVRWVLIHLTWRRRQEQPPWPKTWPIELPLSRSLLPYSHPDDASGTLDPEVGACH